MIRWILIVAMTLMLCIVLYIPSTVAPERFLETLHAEHAINEKEWGRARADRVLSRTTALQTFGGSLSPPPDVATPREPPRAAQAVSIEVARMSGRLFEHPYFRSIDALFLLVCYRLSVLMEMIPLLLVFLAVVAVDGFAMRAVRAKEFRGHSAERFALSVAAGIVLVSAVLVASLLPMQLPPMRLTLVLLGAWLAFSRAIANYHLIH